MLKPNISSFLPKNHTLLSELNIFVFVIIRHCFVSSFDEVTGHYAQMVWGNTRRIGCGKRTYPQRPKRYYKRDTSNAEQSTLQLDEHFQEAQEENIRQARRIENYQSNSRNQFGQENGYQNSDKYQQNYYTQQPTTANNQQYYYSEEPQTPKPVQQNSDIQKKQLKYYKNYLDQMKQLDSPYLSYENKYQLFKELEQKHQILSNIHSRVLYHDQRLKDKIARTKKLNPYIQKGYSFEPDRTVVAGKEFEYYVCNYGPTGLYPGARMYTKGYNNCPYGGLCAGKTLNPLILSVRQFTHLIVTRFPKSSSGYSIHLRVVNSPSNLTSIPLLCGKHSKRAENAFCVFQQTFSNVDFFFLFGVSGP